MSRTSKQQKPVWNQMSHINGVSNQTKKLIGEYAIAQTKLQESFLSDMRGKIPADKKIAFAYKWGIPSVALVNKPASVDLTSSSEGGIDLFDESIAS